MVRGTRVTLLLTVAIAGALASCSSTRWRTRVERPERPAAVAHVEASVAPPLRFGTPTPAELAAVPSARPDASLVLRARFYVARTLPELPLSAPLDHRVRAVVDPASGGLRLAPVLGAGGLVLGQRAIELLPGDPSLAVLADIEAALPPGVTVRIGCETEEPQPKATAEGAVPAPRVSERIAVLLARRIAPTGPDSLEVAIELASARPPAPPPEPAPDADVSEAADRELVRDLLHGARAASPERREVLALAPELLPTRSSFGWALPSPFATGAARWVIVIVEIGPTPSLRDPGAGAHERAVIGLDASLAAERARATAEQRERPPAWRRRVLDRRTLDVAALRSEVAEWPRRGLALLGEQLDADLLLEAALAAPDVVLHDIAGEVERALEGRARREAVGAAVGGAGGALAARARSLRWDVDLATLDALLFGPNRAVTRGVLERRFGVAFGEDGASTVIVEHARRLRSERALENLVLVRNLVALDDPRPGERMIASRWLERLRPGLEGYDPLAPFEERRECVDRLWDALAPDEDAYEHRRRATERP